MPAPNSKELCEALSLGMLRNFHVGADVSYPRLVHARLKVGVKVI